jgi:hypothetical protein
MGAEEKKCAGVKFRPEDGMEVRFVSVEGEFMGLSITESSGPFSMCRVGVEIRERVQLEGMRDAIDSFLRARDTRETMARRAKRQAELSAAVRKKRLGREQARDVPGTSV